MTPEQLCEEFIKQYSDELPHLYEHHPNQLAYLIKLFKYEQALKEAV
jgi:hypothetical protein